MADGFCHTTCEQSTSDLCDHDGEDCWCAPGCDPDFLNNDVCDEACFNEECDYDGHYDDNDNLVSDCYCVFNCLWTEIGDSVCNWDCAVEACSFDNPDCYCDSETLCEWTMKGDAVCNEPC